MVGLALDGGEEGDQMVGYRNFYQKRIGQIIGGNNFDPRHVEAYMRLERGTLDGLSEAEFAEEARIAYGCAQLDLNTAESLAKSFGL